MRIALIGAAGVRTPLLIHGLAEAAEKLPLQEIRFFDIDQKRLAPITRVSKAMAARGGLNAQLRSVDSIEAALDGVDVVISSIRVGGIAARIIDEQVALKHNRLGQETVGAGGFACAMRNLTAMLDYAHAMEKYAPKATLINFTNPVGIVSQGLLNHSSIQVLGVCDTPLEVFESIAAALDLNPFDLRFDYLGLNHLGWIRGIFDQNGKDLLPELLKSPERIKKCYRHGLFPPAFIQDLGLLPTEYLYFYYFPDRALNNTVRSGQSRGQLIEELNEKLLVELAQAPESELVGIYENYLRDRNASYFSIEVTGGELREDDRPLYSQFSGYERIAISLLMALHSDQPSMVPLTVRNEGAITNLESNDAVELPCDVSNKGVVSYRPGAVPVQVQDLLLRVKEYERLTVQAVVTGSREAALEALRKNPLVGDEVAEAILDDYLKAFHGTWRQQ